MDRWKGIKNVVTVGLGMTGISVVNHLKNLDHPLTIKVIDTRDNPPNKEQLPPDVPLHQGGWNLTWLLSADLIVINPGIALATHEIQQAIAANIPVVGDIELFAWHVKKPVIAITGSNGKSTVTDLTGVLAKASGINVAIGGNIGVAALDLLQQDADLYVLELSSFQLETTYSLKLAAAAFLNLTEDHMDRYDDMASYRQAKLRIFNHAQVAIVNKDDPATTPELFHGNITQFSTQERADYETQFIDSIEFLIVHQTPIMPCSALTLVGRHNIANVLTSLALLEQANIHYTENTLDALKNYSGLTHRCQVVENKHGVRWINDSKATNVASTLAALSGLDCDGCLYLLVGGVGKGADFSPLAPILSSLNVQLCCFGVDGEQFMSLHSSAHWYPSMEAIIRAIKPKLSQGDMVMLSPACASFDQFKNFMARGEAFAVLASQYA